jgi:hypothetical protein
MAGAATLFAEGGWYAGRFFYPCCRAYKPSAAARSGGTAETTLAAALPFAQHSDNCHVRGFSFWFLGLDERVGVPCERFV